LAMLPASRRGGRRRSGRRRGHTLRVPAKRRRMQHLLDRGPQPSGVQCSGARRMPRRSPPPARQVRFIPFRGTTIKDPAFKSTARSEPPVVIMTSRCGSNSVWDTSAHAHIGSDRSQVNSSGSRLPPWSGSRACPGSPGPVPRLENKGDSTWTVPSLACTRPVV